MPRKRGTKSSWWATAAPAEVLKLPCGEVVKGDALEFLRALKPECADLVFLDPPFNLGKKYGSSNPKADRLHEEEYTRFMLQVVALSTAVIKPGGSLWLYHMPSRAMALGAHLSQSLTFQHWIAIAMKNGFVRGKSLYPAHYALLHFTKGAPTALHRPKIEPLTCPHCGEFVKDYGGYAEFVKDGVNLSDVWDDVSPVRHTKYKTRSANELPLTIARRVTAIAGTRGGLLVDPFAGSGAILIAGRLAGMKVVGCDREADNCKVIVERFTQTASKRGARLGKE